MQGRVADPHFLGKLGIRQIAASLSQEHAQLLRQLLCHIRDAASGSIPHMGFLMLKTLTPSAFLVCYGISGNEQSGGMLRACTRCERSGQR